MDEISAGHQRITYTTYNTRGDVLETAVWGSPSDFAAWLSDAGGLDHGYGTYQPLTVTRTRYDAHGRAILSVGPTSWSRYVDANAKTPGTRTVYDS